MHRDIRKITINNKNSEHEETLAQYILRRTINKLWR